ncbi:MAG: ECF subfamily RNA polymerase sigma-24 factor [uncultured bacterium]|nr:MAG: ECF subfamily RNA polymerase sigma-24 factor [uncultured bacterium]HCS40516.1 hypothetical protein [Anaerolineaceae bacterium]
MDLTLIIAITTLAISSTIAMLYKSLLDRKSKIEVKTVNYLPTSNISTFINRTEEIELILNNCINSTQKSIIGIFGIAGIGKSQLMLEIGRICNERKIFNFIYYIRAQELPYDPKEDFGDQLQKYFFSTIFYSLQISRNNISDLEKDAIVRATIQKNRILLLIDGLDEVTNNDENSRFLDFLNSLPHTTKIIITSRTRMDVQLSIFLKPFTKSVTDSLIQNNENTIIFKNKLTEEDFQKIYELTSGIPYLINFVLSLLHDYSIESVLSKIETEKIKFLDSMIENQNLKLSKSQIQILIILAAAEKPLSSEDIFIKLNKSISKLDTEDFLLNLYSRNFLISKENKYLFQQEFKNYVNNKWGKTNVWVK